MTNDPYATQDQPALPDGPEPSLVGFPPPSPWSRVPDGPYAAPPPEPYGQYAPPPGPYGQNAALPVPAWAVVKASPMPDGPREYQQMLRGPRYRWWRPLLAVVLAMAIGLPLSVAAFFCVVLVSAVAGVSNPVQWTYRESLRVDNLGPAGFLYTNLSLVVLIPTAGLSVWIAHRIRPGYLASVRGRIRWRWLWRCVAVVVPVWAVYLGLSALVDPVQAPRPSHWGLLLVIVVVLTPLQAAGEEYLFRGWIMQNLGAWFRNPIVGLVVGLVVSVAVFSAAHGSPDPWVLGSLGALALTAGLAAWRTGGLEAGIVIHAVNNVGVFFTVILLGGWRDAFVSANSASTAAAFGVTVLAHAVALTLILWQARKAGIERLYLPADLAPGPWPQARQRGAAPALTGGYAPSE
jgi:membrane protease YdiL (CAAX protease family)